MDEREPQSPRPPGAAAGRAGAFFRDHPQPMIVYDPETLAIVAVNPAAVTHYGFTQAEFRRMSLLDLRPEEDVAEMLRVRRGRVPPYVLPGTFRHRRSDGAVFHAVVTVLAARHRGRAVRVALVADATPERDAFLRALRAEEKFRAIFESAFDAVLLMKGRQFVEVNTRAEELFGATRDRLLGMSPAEVSPVRQPDGETSAARAAERVREAMAGRPQHFDWTHRRLDGTELETEVHLTRLEIAGEVFLKAQVRDVTGDRRRLSELRELRTAVEEGTNIVMLTDADGRIRYVNRRFTIVSGFESAEVLGRSVLEMAAPGAQVRPLQEIAETVRRDGAWHGEFLNRTKAGGTYWERAQISGVTDGAARVTRFLKLAEDITERRAMSEQLEHLASHDAVTGLPNRATFEERLVALVDSRVADGRRAAVLVLDLQGFQLIADNLGREVAEEILRSAARRLRAALGPEVVLARLTRDEFGVLSAPLTQAVEGAEVAQRVLAALEEPIEVDGRSALLRPRVGVAVFPDHAERPSDLLKAASLALGRARSVPGAGFAFFTRSMNVRAQERFELEGELRAALRAGELELHYQPTVALAGGVAGLEALVRWRHPHRGLLAPALFIPMAEENGMIRSIGREVLRQACRQAADWLRRGVPVGRVAVNLSPMQLRAPGFLDQVRSELTAAGLPPDRLELEVTETAAMLDHRRGAEMLGALRALGCRVTLDDFGTGYASLAYLRDLPFDAIKLDRSFVQRVGAVAAPGPNGHGPVDQAILGAVVALARGLGVAVVAEGVETEDQLQAVKHAGCDAVQGYLLARPAPAEEIEGTVRRLAGGHPT